MGNYVETVFVNCHSVPVQTATRKHSQPLLDALNASHMSFRTLVFRSYLTALSSNYLKPGYIKLFFSYLPMHKPNTPLCGNVLNHHTPFALLRLPRIA